MKLWGGRFQKNTDKAVDDFNSSISFDTRLYKYDLQGSIAHAKMLGLCGIIPSADSELIQKSLQEILDSFESGKLEFDFDSEDIHTFIEQILISKIGDTSKKLHSGRSRNDQVALDTKMYVKDEISAITEMLKLLEIEIIEISEKNLDTIMPGYTHLQHAQPITVAHHLMAYFQMFKRDIERLGDCYKRTDIMPLGSGALAGTSFPIDRKFVAKELNFASITENSIDGVSDRDYAIEFASCISLIMMHLSRFCEEIILWSSSEFGFVELDDAYTTGSSIMPQKKNPDVAELVRGKSGRVYGNLVTLLTMMKSLPLAYNKDMQEDKEALFDSIDTVKLCLPVFTKMISTMKFNTEKMYKEAKCGFTNATDLADYLVKKGTAFRDAHEIVGKVVLYCIDKSKSIEELTVDEFISFSDTIKEDVYGEINIEKCISSRNLPGGTSKESVVASIKNGKCFLEEKK